MDLFIYRNNGVKLDFVGMCSDAVSVLWIRRFFRGDSFTIEVPATSKNLEMFQKYHIVAYGDNAGYITAYDIDVKGKIIAKGTSFDGMLTRRVLVNFSAKDSVMKIIDKNAVSLAEEGRQFKATVVDYNVDADGLTSEITQYQKMSDYINIIGHEFGFGVFGKINHSTNFIELYGRYGVDRSKNQKDVKPVIFSDTLGNATDITYSYNSDAEINAVIAYSPAEKDFINHIDVYPFEEEFYSGGYHNGYEVRETAVKINAVSTEELRGVDWWRILDYDITYAVAQNAAANTYSMAIDNVACRLILHSDYRSICDVGDIVTVYSQKYNVTANKMITEIREFTDSTKQTIEAVIGDPQKTFVDAVADAIKTR